MTDPHRLRLVPAPLDLGTGRTGRFASCHPYAPAVWLPILGPAAYVTWHELSRRAVVHPAGCSITLAQVAIDVGLGPPAGRRSPIVRAVRRLDRFGLARDAGGSVLVVSTLLPAASPAQLARIDPVVQRRHRHLCRASVTV